MEVKSFKTLEFNKIIDKLQNYAGSELGKKIAGQLTPYTDIDEIKLHQGETSEAVTMILKKGSLGMGGLRDISTYIKRVNVGGSLNIVELLHIADFLRVAKRAKGYGQAEGKNDSFPILEPRFNAIELANDLERDIERCIISPTEVSDDASSTLREIRRNIKISNDRIKEQLNSIIHSASYRNMLQDPVITIRNDRYCVPVKQEYKNAFSGMIHDQSATGATVFIEPMSVVNLNNRIAELLSNEKVEIERILALLSSKVAEYDDLLLSNQEILADLDFVFAKGELSISMKATEPIFNTKGYINIKKARHPLLNPETVVPTNIYIGKDFNTLLITGPNTGGKTVTLKTVGLFTLMGQSGLHISAFDNSQLTVFDEVFADIGDEQSIEQSLSTFSSHMTNIVKILDKITNNSLVLLDELGAGTDPTEGAALAISIIQYLHKIGVRTLVTTHYSELKLFALSTDGVENASCEFDVQTLRPTYRLLIGVPGKSNAFAISQRLGLPEFLIEDAKEVERLRVEAQKQREKLNSQREKIIRKANEEARILISDAKDEADKVLKEIRKLQRTGNTKAIEEKRQSLKDKMSKVESKLTKNEKKNYNVPEKLVIGDKVKVHSLNQSGVVATLPDKNGNVTVKTGIMKVTVSIKDLSLDQSDSVIMATPKRFASSIKRKKASNVSAEIDLRGCLADEAIDLVDKYLDDAYLAGVSPVTIIHGKGTGALRKAVHTFLKTNAHVKSFRLGQYGEGESGVTVVELK